MRFSYVLIAVAALAGCASDPAKQVSKPPVAAAAAPVPSVAAPAPVETGDSKASAGGEYLPPPGYQKKTKGSTTVYCRRDTPVGTRFATESCYTQVELERMDASRTNIRQELERARRTCTGAGCGG